MGVLLVHPQGAAGDAAAHILQAEHFQLPLDGSVLGVGAVHEGKSDVDGLAGSEPILIQGRQVDSPGVAEEFRERMVRAN